MYNPTRTTSYPPDPIDKGFRYHFLGGGEEVGNVGCIIEDYTKSKLLFDYGLAPTKPPKYPAAAPKISDSIIISRLVKSLSENLLIIEPPEISSK